MKNNTSQYLIVILLLVPMLMFGQRSQPIPANAEVTHAEKIGTIPPLRTLIPVPAHDAERRKFLKMRRKAPNNFAGRGKRGIENPNALPQGPDRLRQTDFGRSSNNLPIEPLVNIDGITSNSSPNDPTGEIGRDYYMQSVNVTRIAIYDKEGNQINVFDANTLWSSLGFSSAGDPIVMYDQEVNRWIITEFPSGNQLLFAISDDSDPLGGYTAYNFGTPNFPDYPKYSIWNNAYVVTTNEQGAGASPCYFIDRQDILNGENTPTIQRIQLPGVASGPGFQVDAPVDWTGLTPPAADAQPMILSMIDDAWGAPADAIDVYSFDIDFNNSANTTYTVQNIPTSPFDSKPCSATGVGWACIPQLGGGGIDGGPEVIMNMPHYRNFGSHESMILNFITDVDGNNLAGIRWMELRRNAGATDWSIYQEGTFSPDDGLNRFYASMEMDGSGNIGMAYSVSSASTYVGTRFTGRRASDPLGEMTVQEYTAVEGQSTISSGGRFGDYSHMSIDPVNDRTFWFTTEYAGPNGVNTRILAFELRKDTTDIGPSALVTPQSAALLTANETVTIDVKNFGLDTQSVFTVGYILENGAAVTEQVNYQLFPDSTYQHSFATPVDMSTIGDYNFKVFTALGADQAILNDTLRAVVSHLPRFDAGITMIDNLPTFTCESPISTEAVLSNFGTETLTSAIIEISLNGTVVETINWTGNLTSGSNEAIAISLDGFVVGDNFVEITVTNPNGEADQNSANNGRTELLEFVENGEDITLTLQLDNYPSETSWNLTDENGAIVYSGGPYSNAGELIVETWCLPADGCYTFEILDSYGDGICCGAFSGNGNYNVAYASGVQAISSNGQFGGAESNDFCAVFTCALTASYTVLNETGAGGNGGVLITAENGATPYTYSIDGGDSSQYNNLFNNIPAGDYFVQVTDANNCVFNDTVSILNCAIEMMADVQDVTADGATDGSLTIIANGGTPPYTYAINSQSNYQNSPVFDNLGMGNYTIYIKDANGCTLSSEFTVGTITSTETFDNGHLIEVYPNPTDGAVQIKVTGLEGAGVFLPLQVIGADGKLLYESTITRYDGNYIGMVSFVGYPSGVYYVRLVDEKITRLLKVVKR